MGLFSKKSRESVASACEVCGAPGHDRGTHVVQIRGDEPSWLPAGWRRQAQGEFTFLCVRCGSFPDAKWPHSGGADAALQIHLGSKHSVGQFKNSGMRQDFGMVKADAGASATNTAQTQAPRQSAPRSETMPVSSNRAMPVFDDPDDVTRWKMVHAAHAAVKQMIDTNEQCHEKAVLAEKAFAMANTDVVNGIRQAEISKNTFLKHGIEKDRELQLQLAELRDATARAKGQWNNLMLLFSDGTDEHGIPTWMGWCMSHHVDSNVYTELISYGAFIGTDYGLTRESFWAEAQRIEQILGAGPS